MDNYYINKILEEKKITTFLEEKGILPVKETGNKIIYHCPIHSGDNDPSFIIYEIGTKGRNYQTYYCYGCHSGINIINLKSDLEKISIKESIRYFLKDIKIDKKNVMESIIDDIQKGNIIVEEKKEIETLLLLINSICREHLLIYKDEEEIQFFEDFFKKIDDIAREKDIHMLEKIYYILTDKGGIDKRVENFQKRQENKELSLNGWKL